MVNLRGNKVALFISLACYNFQIIMYNIPDPTPLVLRVFLLAVVNFTRPKNIPEIIQLGRRIGFSSGQTRAFCPEKKSLLITIGQRANGIQLEESSCTQLSNTWSY